MKKKILSFLYVNKSVVKLFFKQFVKPKESFDEIIIEKIDYERLVKALYLYYSFFFPLLFILFSTDFTQNGNAIFVNIILAFFIAALLIPLLSLLTSINALLFSFIFYFLGKIFQSKGSIENILSIMILFIAGFTLVVVVDTFMMFGILKYFSTNDILLYSIFAIPLLIYYVYYLPIALSKSLKISLLKSSIIAFIPLILSSLRLAINYLRQTF